MKAIVNVAAGKLDWQDRPMPEPGPGQVRIRTAFCGICATDLEMIDGWQRTGFPSIPGHEWSGWVDAVGHGVNRSLLGRGCVAENTLADGGEVGFEHPGGYGQFLLTGAANVRVLPEQFPMDSAALIEPLAVCVRAVRRLRIERTDDAALVVGDGVIGLLTLILLKRGGVKRVALVGGRAARLAVAVEFGADAVANYHDSDDTLSALVGRLPGAPFACVVEASGSAAGMIAGLDAAAHGGKVLIVGDYGQARADFAWNHLLHRELELIGSNASAGAWDEAVAMASRGEMPLGRLISHRLPAADFARGIELARHDRTVLKVVLDWRAEQQ